jgi:AraC family transcriptional regulator
LSYDKNDIQLRGDEFLAKIAVDLEKALEQRALQGASAQTNVRLLAKGDHWKVEDVICTAGPRDRRFEERHVGVTIAIVAAGSFQYRGALGQSGAQELMTPGSLVLGNAGQAFDCGHEHGAGDRCIAFSYAPEYFEGLAADVGARGGINFRVLRVPPLRMLSPMIAQPSQYLSGQKRRALI